MRDKGRITLVTGGVRSGKSRYAVQRAGQAAGRLIYLATAQPQDAELQARITRHQEERKAADWETVEEPFEVPEAILRCAGSELLLVDCLTLWLANMLQRDDALDEQDAAKLGAQLVRAAQQHGGEVLLVSNEVGLGIHPPTALGRQYCDLLGRLNQAAANSADEVVLMVCGQPLQIK